MASTPNTFYCYATPAGPLTIAASAHGLTCINFGDVSMNGVCRPTALTNAAATQFQEYLAGKRTLFDVALDMQGSPFQEAVWVEVSFIPYGETRTAAQIAQALGKPGSHRAVGTAINQNKLAPFIPTHRVLAKNATGAHAKIFRAFQALEQRARMS